jgi:hypothetical protein
VVETVGEVVAVRLADRSLGRFWREFCEPMIERGDSSRPKE